MSKSEVIFILKSYLIWLLGLFSVLYFAFRFIPLQENFLGGGMQNYLQNPFFWAWGNFDGEHYLSIAQVGYQPLTYFFFPLYPVLIKLFGSTQLSGLVISNISFIAALTGFYKVLKLDFSEKISRLTIIILLAFPASFFFAGLYTESLFLALVVWSFYFYRAKKYFFSGFLGLLASSTRLIGAILLPAYIIEVLVKEKKVKPSHLPLLMIPLGLGIYMYYLFLETGDPFNFFNTVGIFGEQRGTSLTLLPQVFYRYIFKILPSLNYSDVLFFFTPLVELLLSSIAIFLLFSRTKLSYYIYLLLGYLVPTLAGSFSSMPRYLVVLFPIYFLLATRLIKLPNALIISVIILLALINAAGLAMFARGYWFS